MDGNMRAVRRDHSNTNFGGIIKTMFSNLFIPSFGMALFLFGMACFFMVPPQQYHMGMVLMSYRPTKQQKHYTTVNQFGLIILLTLLVIFVGRRFIGRVKPKIEKNEDLDSDAAEYATKTTDGSDQAPSLSVGNDSNSL